MQIEPPEQRFKLDAVLDAIDKEIQESLESWNVLELAVLERNSLIQSRVHVRRPGTHARAFTI
jgi:hypothetical protein